ESQCKFQCNGILCSGFAKLGKIVNYLTNTSSYFIGCTKYRQNDKWHRFIKININEIDLSLLKKLFAGELIEEKDQAICTSIILRSCKRKLCEFPHIKDGQITRGNIVEKACSVRFIIIIPLDIS
ncbi:5231_t:CDS:2, partial [Gigaspora rosea]